MKITGIEITLQEGYEILTDAIETRAIQYWACDYGPIKIWREPKTSLITKAVFHADDEAGKKTKYTVTPATIERGILRLLRLGDYLKIDGTDTDFDSEDCDNIIQAALFGEIIYG